MSSPQTSLATGLRCQCDAPRCQRDGCHDRDTAPSPYPDDEQFAPGGIEYLDRHFPNLADFE
jgi:hypothetical protein